MSKFKKVEALSFHQPKGKKNTLKDWRSWDLFTGKGKGKPLQSLALSDKKLAVKVEQIQKNTLQHRSLAHYLIAFNIQQSPLNLGVIWNKPVSQD